MARIVVFSGEYDLANRDALRSFLSHLETCDDLVFDLTAVTFIDSSFLTELVRLEKARKANNLGRITIVSRAESALRRLFEITGLVSELTLVESYGRDDPDAVVEFAPTGDTMDDTAVTEAGGNPSATA